MFLLNDLYEYEIFYIVAHMYCSRRSQRDSQLQFFDDFFLPCFNVVT